MASDETPSPEDKRSAVSLSVTLSNQLTTFALALLTIEMAFITYVLSNNETIVGFKFVAFLSAISFIISIISGGKGISRSGSSGYRGDWNFQVGRPYFNGQATFGFVGIILLVISVFLSGASNKSDILKHTENLKNNLSTIEIDINTLKSNYKDIQNEVKNNKNAIERLKISTEKKISP